MSLSDNIKYECVVKGQHWFTKDVYYVLSHSVDCVTAFVVFSYLKLKISIIKPPKLGVNILELGILRCTKIQFRNTNANQPL